MRVVLADDFVLFREGLSRVLEEACFEIVGQAGDAGALFELVRAEQPDAAIVDIRMPPTRTTEGLVVAERIRAEHPHVGVLLLSHYVEAQHALRLIGSSSRGIGYLLKDRVCDVAEFADAVRRVATGGSVIDPEVVTRLVEGRRRRDPLKELTQREREVLALMAEGCSNQAIGERLFLTPKTVESHVRNIFIRLDLPATPDDHRRVRAVLTYLRS